MPTLRIFLPKHWFILFALTTSVGDAFVHAQEPDAASKGVDDLAARIDLLLAEVQVYPASGLCNDVEYLRRLSLDLRGIIPTAEEVRAFLDDRNENKRVTWAERWLNSVDFDLHWAEVLDVILMERRPDQHVSRADWIHYLQQACFDGKTWADLSREIFTADGTDPATRPAAKFWLERQAEPHLLTRDLGRIFFGMDLACAQCHDHPLIEHYTQTDYYGLFAFVNRLVLFNDEANKRMILAERAEGDADFKSVFTGDASRTRPRLPGSHEFEEPHFRLGEEYQVEPAEKIRPIPRHPRRTLLVAATDGSHSAFNRNIANRIWAVLFGRGLVHPVDLHHPHNPPVHPGVLDAVTQYLVEQQFDHRALISLLVRTQAYQRAYDTPAHDHRMPLTMLEERINRLRHGQQNIQAEATEYETQHLEWRQKVQAAVKTWEAPDKAYQEARRGAEALRKPLREAQAALEKTKHEHASWQQRLAALQQVNMAGQALLALLKEPELEQAAQIFVRRAESVQAQLAKLEETIQAQTAAVEQARAKWLAAVDQAEQAYAQLVTAMQEWEHAKQQWHSVRHQWMERVTRVQSGEVALKDLQRALQEQQLLQAEREIQLALDELAVGIAQTQQLVEAQQRQVDQHQQLFSETERTLQLSQQLHQTALEKLQREQQIQLTLREAIGKVELALSQLSGDADLSEALAKLKQRLPGIDDMVNRAQREVEQALQNVQQGEEKVSEVRKVLQAAQQQLQQSQEQLKLIADQLSKRQQQQEQLRSQRDALKQQLEEDAARQFALKPFKPLTPEQLAWSMMRACGIIDSYHAQAEKEIEQILPRQQMTADPVQTRRRDFLVAQKTYDQLAGTGVFSVFATFFGNGPGQPQDQFYASVDQALFVANHGMVRGWTVNLANLLQTQSELTSALDLLYLRVLSRTPTPQEQARDLQHLQQRDDRSQAWQELVWALLASAEFRFDH
ncbi:MAG: hypothetical protein KatS3mg113_0376 [Planctomycetaceae bacterium]|nr:MAG: hypothetical protein KatS3mg113_0376 [Planctomycetaceae bacterium]